MSHRQPRPTALPSHIRPSSVNLTTSNTRASASNSGPQPSTNLLQTRIGEKKRELDDLKQLRDLSAGLAGQMAQLEQKLGTLSSGTEAVAEVVGNWNAVLRAVWMASSNMPKPPQQQPEGEEVEEEEREGERELPQTLVRIPIQQAELAQREAEAAVAASAVTEASGE